MWCIARLLRHYYKPSISFLSFKTHFFKLPKRYHWWFFFSDLDNVVSFGFWDIIRNLDDWWFLLSENKKKSFAIMNSNSSETKNRQLGSKVENAKSWTIHSQLEATREVFSEPPERMQRIYTMPHITPATATFTAARKDKLSKHNCTTSHDKWYILFIRWEVWLTHQQGTAVMPNKLSYKAKNIKADCMQ